MHRCTDACKYYISRRHTVAVCRSSRHTHVCGKSVCTLGTATRDTSTACTITGYEVGAQAEVLYASLRSANSFNRSSRMHWSSPRKRVRTHPAILRRRSIEALATMVFCSPHRIALTAIALKKREDQCKKVLKDCRQRTYWTFAKVRAVVLTAAKFVRPPATVVPAGFVTYVCNSVQLLQAESAKRQKFIKKNDTVVALGLLQLLETGFCPRGTRAIHQHPFATAHGLDPAQYARLPGIRARQQTISVRQIQRLCVDDDGRTVLQLPPPPSS